jgi:hypothetical protein
MSSIHLTDLPHHNVLHAPWTYRVVALTFLCDAQRDQTLELSLQKGSELVLLRFEGVSQLEIEEGFPWHSAGMQILDASSEGMEVDKVRVSSFEQNPAIKFWARSVERVVA